MAIYDTALSVAQVQNHYEHQYYGTVNINLVQGGVTVASIAQDVLNTGSYVWTIPGSVPLANNYQIQVQANEGSQPAGYSSGVFTITNDGPDYYVSASGDNAASGKDPSQPMASLGALLNAYTLGPGDTIYVAAGSYTPLTNLVVPSGVTVMAPAALPRFLIGATRMLAVMCSTCRDQRG